MNKDSIFQSTLFFLEVLFIGALIFSPLMESVKALSNLNYSLEQEYTEIMTRAVNPSIFSTITQIIIALGMYLQFRINKTKKRPLFFPFIFILGFLVINSFFWNWITQIQGAEIFQLQEVHVQNIFLMILATSFAAFYEEIVYRWFGPYILSILFLKKQREGSEVKNIGYWIKNICLEAPLIIIFGLSHGYGGWTAVGNALVAGLVLRLCTIKVESPFPSFFAHLAYNFFQFFLLLK